MKKLALALLLGWTAVQAGEVSLTLTPRQARIGDQIEIRAVIKTDSDIDRVELIFPAEGMEMILRQDPPSRLFQGSRIFEKAVVIAFFDIGTHTVGPFTVNYYRGEALITSETVDPQTVAIQSALTDQDKDIAPLKDPLAIRGNPRYLLSKVFIVLFLAALIVAAVLYWKRRGREKPVSAPLTLEEEFARRISTLLDNRQHTRGEFRAFFIQLTDTMKWFLHHQYNFPAEDYTSWETVQAMVGREQGNWIPDRLQHLFEVADEVKFARIVPRSDSMDAILHDLPRFVSEYRRRRKAVEEAQHAGSGK